MTFLFFFSHNAVAAPSYVFACRHNSHREILHVSSTPTAIFVRRIVSLAPRNILVRRHRVCNLQVLTAPHWAYNPGIGQRLNITYKWGVNLPSNSPWRNAFSSSVSDWNNVGTAIFFNYKADSKNSFDLYYRCDNTAGETPFWTKANGTLKRFIARANTCYSHTTNVNRSITGHELGHGGGLGHLCSSEGMALMGWNPNPESMYRPQATDERYAHDIYHMGQ